VTGPQVLNVHAFGVQPFDMFNEGQWVREVVHYTDGRGPGFTRENPVFLVVYVASLHVERTTVNGFDLLDPCWGDPERIVLDPDVPVTVVRGMDPPVADHEERV
jgi:hypothetical protein